MDVRPLWLWLIVSGLLPASGHGADTAGVAWKELSFMKANDARRIFAATGEIQPANRAARFGHAVALLAVQPRTAGNIAQAAEMFEALRSGNPNDDTGIGAAYYLARIQQLHGFTPDRLAAVAGYRALFAAHPEHHYAQLAAAKLALLLLYDDVPPAEWEQRVTEVQALIPRLTAPEAARDTRLTLAMAFIRLRHDHARAYPLFAACFAAGTVTRMPRLNTVLVQAAESADVLGKKSEVAAYYADFLAHFPNDSKSDEIRRRLDQLNREARP